ncbi:MAG: hypothetical protein ACR2I2_13135 [Bryobacteraceae bacterium]
MNELGGIIARLEQQKAALDRALSALRQVGGSDGSSSATSAQPKAAVTKTGGITPAGRRKLSEASRMRWAQKRAAQAEQERAEKNAAAAQKRRTTIARKKMSETMKQRWAAKRAKEASQQKTAQKTASSRKSAAVKKQAAGKKATSKQEAAPAEA